MKIHSKISLSCPSVCTLSLASLGFDPGLAASQGQLRTAAGDDDQQFLRVRDGSKAAPVSEDSISP